MPSSERVNCIALTFNQQSETPRTHRSDPQINFLPKFMNVSLQISSSICIYLFTLFSSFGQWNALIFKWISCSWKAKAWRMSWSITTYMCLLNDCKEIQTLCLYVCVCMRSSSTSLLMSKMLLTRIHRFQQQVNAHIVVYWINTFTSSCEWMLYNLNQNYWLQYWHSRSVWITKPCISK